jgi:hypothetical protein
MLDFLAESFRGVPVWDCEAVIGAQAAGAPNRHG